jgi:hypothetical protein
MPDGYLSKKLTVSEMAQSRRGIIEEKHAIDDRPDAVLLHYAVHVLEIASTADCDRSKRTLTVQTAHCASQHPDHGHLAAIRDCLDRLHQRFGATDLNHAIHATTPVARKRSWPLSSD